MSIHGERENPDPNGSIKSFIEGSHSLEEIDVILEGIQKSGIGNTEKGLRSFMETINALFENTTIPCECGKEEASFVRQEGLGLVYRCPCDKETIT